MRRRARGARRLPLGHPHRSLLGERLFDQCDPRVDLVDVRTERLPLILAEVAKVLGDLVLNLDQAGGLLASGFQRLEPLIDLLQILQRNGFISHSRSPC